MTASSAGNGRTAPMTPRTGHKSWWPLVSCIAIGLCVAVGCGRRGPSVEMVEGLVLMDGEPLAGASVGFAPISLDQGLHAVGLTDAAGEFRLTAMRGGAAGAGTAIGDYGVIVSKMLSRDPESKEPVAKPKPGAVVPKLVKPGYGMMDYIVLVPEAYGDAATSGLAASVKKGVNKVTFELRSDFSPPSPSTPVQPSAARRP